MTSESCPLTSTCRPWYTRIRTHLTFIDWKGERIKSCKSVIICPLTMLTWEQQHRKDFMVWLCHLPPPPFWASVTLDKSSTTEQKLSPFFVQNFFWNAHVSDNIYHFMAGYHSLCKTPFLQCFCFSTLSSQLIHVPVSDPNTDNHVGIVSVHLLMYVFLQKWILGF